MNWARTWEKWEDLGSDEVWYRCWYNYELEFGREGGTYADYEVFGVDEVVLEDCREDGAAEFSCWACEGEHFVMGV